MRALAVCCVATATALNVQRRNVLGGAATAALAVAPVRARRGHEAASRRRTRVAH